MFKFDFKLQRVTALTTRLQLWQPNRVALSWSELCPDFPAFHIKYEDLIGGKVDFRKLESWLGIDIREDAALAVFVGRTARRHRLGWCERWIISHEAAAGMDALGYTKAD